jgi:flotillin
MFTALAIFSAVSFFLFTMMFLTSRYQRCPSNRILAVFGKLTGDRSVKCYHGGGAFVWPVIQDYAFLDLTPITLHIPLKSALSLQNIRINVPSTFTVAIDTLEEAMTNAAIRLLGLSPKDIELMATEIIIGQLRLTVASLTIEEINQDRERFLLAIRKHIEPELRKIGLALLNVNITDITDESGYIDSIGRKSVSTALNQAKIDVAQQEKHGDIGKALAERDRRIQVAESNADAVSGENDSRAKIAANNANLFEQEAIAEKQGKIAQYSAMADINKAKQDAETKRLEAEQLVPKDIEKRRMEIEASAHASRARIEAEGQAAAILAVKTAEAEGSLKVLQAKADGYRQLIEACNNSPQQAANMLLVEKLEEIVKLQAEAIKNIKIDKITVWESGDGKNGSSTANFISGMVKSLPPLHDIAAMSGINLPDYLGSVNNGSVQGARKASPDAEQSTE